MLKDRIILVSGGTGFLGSAICQTSAHYGAKVYFTYYRNQEKAEELMNTIEGSKGIRINLKDVNDIKKGIEELYDKIEAVDILVNNAGTSQIMPLALLEKDDVDLLIDVNVIGSLFLTKAIVRRMIRQKRGSVVNIGSIAGHRILEAPVHYATTKAAISGFTISLASELKRYGIRVNSVVPGILEEGVSRGVPEKKIQEYLKHCIAGRLGTGKEIAEVVCFLASDRASYVNGQNIFVDGGI